MLLTITATSHSPEVPATDLGYLLHKNPARIQQRELSFGLATVAYPEATAQRCTIALIVDMDPIKLLRRAHGRRRNLPATLQNYVNDRPYVASSFLSTAVAKMFGTAMSGRCKDRPELVDQRLSLSVNLPAVPSDRGPGELHRLFEPLGYAVSAVPIPLDPAFPDWGPSNNVNLTLSGEVTVQNLLTHLYVLIPVLDNEKHYWVGKDEVDRLILRGDPWLAKHPDRESIARRYLRHDRQLTQDALARLMADGDTDPAGTDSGDDAAETAVERPVRLNDLRLDAVVSALENSRSRSIVDLGCGQGSLVARLLATSWVDRVVGVDVSWRALQVAGRRLHLEDMAPRQRERVDLWQGALTYRDTRLRGFDAAAVVEVIEHMDPLRLEAFAQNLFGDASPNTIVVTTPNIEYNTLFGGMKTGSLRHRDHRFEWTRAQFREWAATITDRYGYTVTFSDIGPVDTKLGSPTQMGVFSR